ncbi:MAG: hypothetical protein M1168_01400 [Candidatus Marsarchaeota archaeon]|nr:hypothetical protein [Candidatus Marsarchaeota archaeon]MCL5094619.1 hypothetical protein [Candidatus Marsarchaeota archaeon]
METGKQIESELYDAIDSLVNEMNQRLGISEKKSDADLGLSDLHFEKDLITHIKNLVEYRKISERFLEDELIEIKYEISLELSCQNLKQTNIKKLI